MTLNNDRKSGYPSALEYVPTDISDIEKNQINWKKKTITRKRSKTKKKGNVPVVQYRLWDRTFTLLKKHKSNHPELVLTRFDGTPLRQCEINEEDEIK